MNHCETNVDNLMSSCGNTHGFDFCVSMLFKGDDNIFMEVPTYHFFVKIVQDRGLNVF
jgi:DNA-binding transcriptional MocR family regulator